MEALHAVEKSAPANYAT